MNRKFHNFQKKIAQLQEQKMAVSMQRENMKAALTQNIEEKERWTSSSGILAGLFSGLSMLNWGTGCPDRFLHTFHSNAELIPWQKPSPLSFLALCSPYMILSYHLVLNNFCSCYSIIKSVMLTAWKPVLHVLILFINFCERWQWIYHILFIWISGKVQDC